jgi:competence protein ComEC
MRSAILAFVFGVWLLQQQAVLPSPWWYAAAPAFLLLSWLSRRNPRLLRASLLLLPAVAGFLWAALMAQHRLSDALPPQWEGRDIRIVGVVASLPQASQRSERFLFDVEQVETSGAVVPHHISLTSYFAGFDSTHAEIAAKRFRPGERWRLTVRLKRPHGSYNPHGFDFEAWALERDIRAGGYVRPQSTDRLDGFVMAPAYVVERAREMVRKRFERVLGSSPYRGELLALAIGDESAIDDGDWEIFRRTGVVHLMSISGLHVTMIASLGFALVYAGWRRSERLTLALPARKAAAVAGMLCAGSYALLAGFSVPTQRTLYMLVALAVALWSGRPVSMSLALCWALLAVIVPDPWAVLAPGFWLSFGAVGLLIYAGSHRLTRLGWQRESLHAQWVVTLGLAPMLLMLFQQVSLVSPLANALAIPLISLVVTPLALAGAVLPIDALLTFSHAVMAACMRFLQWSAALPFAVWEQPAPPAWALAASLAGVVWLLAPRGFPMRWAGVAGFAPLLFLMPETPSNGAAQLAVLDVGQGLSVLIRTEHHAMLYDAGPKYNEEADAGNRVVLPYLRSVGVVRLDGMVVSHDDIDHSGGAPSVLKAVPVGWMLSPLPADHPLRGRAGREVACMRGQSWMWDGVRFDVMHPDSGSYADGRLADNARSCVLRVVSRSGTVLIAGDIEAPSEEELLQVFGSGIRADVLIVPHHGSKTSSTPEFVQAVQPRVAIFTAGYRNRFGHPRREVVERYREVGSRVLRSDRDGAILLDMKNPDDIRLIPWRQTESRYWLDREAGLAEMDGAG